MKENMRGVDIVMPPDEVFEVATAEAVTVVVVAAVDGVDVEACAPKAILGGKKASRWCRRENQSHI
jgi:hypothetical protein